MTRTNDGRSGFAARSVPAELKARQQWVGFKIIPNGKGKPKKVPVIAAEPQREASCTDPRTWGSFDVAHRGLTAGAYDAIGYALNGEVVGIDLDGERWVTPEGELSEEAKAIVDRLGSYAEWSHSGKGIHILLYGVLPGRGRRNSGAGLEVYQQARFFVTTGRRLADAPETVNENQAALGWVMRTYFGSDARLPGSPTEKPESTEVMTSAVSVPSVGSGLSALSGVSAASAFSVDEIIGRTTPQKVGQRNACVFDLARGLKHNAGMRAATARQLKPIVRKWHAQALPAIGTKEFDETWADFLRAWDIAFLPLCTEIEAWALAKAKAEPLPAAGAEYDMPQVRLLVGVCWHLASLNTGRRFFLSSHRIGTLLGVSHDKAHRWLRMLCADEVLQVVERGNERRATRYRYIHGGEGSEHG